METPPAYVVLNKEISETPLQCLLRYKGAHPELVGEACKHRERYDKLDKEYEFEVLLGFSSDTGDVLGMIQKNASTTLSLDRLQSVLRSLVGEHQFAYPLYSSKTIKGVPLFEYASHNSLANIEIPVYTSRIYDIALVGQKKVSFGSIASKAIDQIGRFNPVENAQKPNADFRKPGILSRWKEYSNESYEMQILTFRAIVSSGTYVRTIAEQIGKALHSSGMTLSIRRTKIGVYLQVYKKLGFWMSQY
jgi:tRNA pseudouridine55 synthase